MTIKLTRNPIFSLFDPAVDDIERLLHQIEDAGEEDGEQSMILSTESESTKSNLHSELWVMRLNDRASDKMVGWLVRFKNSSKRRSLVLAEKRPEGALVTLELCGALNEIRAECILKEEAAKVAIHHFRIHGEPDSSHIWLDFLDSVRPL